MKRGLDDVDVGAADDGSSSSKVDISLSSCMLMGSHVHVSKMPWELTPALQEIFTGDNTPWLRAVKIPRSLPAISASQPARPVSDKTTSATIRRSVHTCVASKPDNERSKALLKRCELVMTCPSHSMVGQQMMVAQRSGYNGDHILTILADSLQSKATATVSLRASSLALYTKWHSDWYPDEEFLPFSEERVYEYLCDLRAKACSASRGSTFVSTLSFVKGRFGMSGVDSCVASPRVQGAALNMYLEKRPLRQAPPLQPMMIAALEFGSFCERDTHMRAMCGFILCCRYGRLRISDLNRLVHLTVSGKFAEGSLMRTKTARNKEKQTTFLPVVIPCFGITGINWFEAFIASRRHLKLAEVPSLESKSSARDFVLLPSAVSLGYELQQPVSTTEVTHALQYLLGKIFQLDVIKDFTSHSLKTTLLTYLGVAGVDPTHAELLGYHLTQHVSALNYQRNALAAPIRFMCNMLDDIRAGRFEPVAARDAIFRPVGQRKEVVDQLCDYTGKKMEEISEAYLGCSLEHMSKSPFLHELRELWDMICCEPTSLADATLDSGEVADEAIDSEDKQVGDAATVNASDSSDGDSDSGSSSAEEAMANLLHGNDSSGIRNVSAKALDGSFFRNIRTKTIHMEHVDSAGKTACGRFLSDMFVRFHGDIEKAWPHCTSCFGNMNA